MYHDIYKDRIKLAREQNAYSLIDDMRHFKEKLDRHSDKYPEGFFSVDRMMECWPTLPPNIHRFILSLFAKDPAKQFFHENYAEELMRNVDSITDVNRLVRVGDEALYLVDGIMVSGRDIKERSISRFKTTKSIDFSFRYEDILYYAMHKYTNEGGGSQDNQFKDVEYFAYKAREITRDINGTVCKFAAIIDGGYYQSRIRKLRTTYPSVCVADILSFERELIRLNG